MFEARNHNPGPCKRVGGRGTAENRKGSLRKPLRSRALVLGRGFRHASITTVVARHEIGVSPWLIDQFSSTLRRTAALTTRNLTMKPSRNCIRQDWLARTTRH